MMKMRLLGSLLLLLLFLCMAHPCFGASGREMVVVFKGGQTEVLFKQKNVTITQYKPRAFRVPAFVGGVFNGKEFLLALCDTRYNGFSYGSFIEAVAKTSYGDYTKWSDAGIVVKNTWKSKTHSVVGDLTAVMKGNKIYVLASRYVSSCKCGYYKNHDIGWNPLMIVGTVMSRTDSNSGADEVYVQWEKQSSLKSILPKTVLGAQGFRFVGGVGNGVVTKSGTIVLPIQIANVNIQYAASIMYSTDDGSSWHIGGTTEEGTSECSVTEWGNGKLLLSARYDGGVRKVYESDNMGTTWKESTMLSQVWGNQQYRTGVGSQGSLITVSVDGKDVLLFSHPLNTKGGLKRDTLQLWMSDGQRIKCVGTISEDGKGERSGYSILAHVGNHLYSMHEINPFLEGKQYNSELEEWDRVIAISSIPDLFHKVKNTARAWRQVDKKLRENNVPTNGLVGFLADSNCNSVWEDEYNSVKAFVSGATPVPGGFRFDGTQGSGAPWPVQSQGQNQFYIFTKKQFTLAAKVQIHEIQRYGNYLLLGASEDEVGTRALISLGYTQDEGWYVMYSGGIFRNNKVPLVLHNEYHLAITYDQGALDVYVNGESIMNGRQRTYTVFRIRHFCIGGIVKYSTENGLLITVKHVMLYNRALNKSEIVEIKKVDKYVHQDIPMISTEQTGTAVAPTLSPATQYKDTSMGFKSDPNVILKDSESSATTHNKVTTDSDSHETPPEDGKDKADKQGSTAGKSDADNSESEENNNDKTVVKT